MKAISPIPGLRNLCQALQNVFYKLQTAETVGRPGSVSQEGFLWHVSWGTQVFVARFMNWAWHVRILDECIGYVG